MDCTHCKVHRCRVLGNCSAQQFDKEAIKDIYQSGEVTDVVRSSARLVDNGRAGTLNRLQEFAEYALDRGFKRLGVAYCFSMEKDAGMVGTYLSSRGLQVAAVSCTTGGLAQDEVNSLSTIHKVTCNPIGQNEQLNMENVEMVVAVGLCLGHGMLLQKQCKAPVTTLEVKDRTSDHAPLAAIRSMNLDAI